MTAAASTIRHVPVLPWSAQSRWRARPATIVVLLAGLWLFGTGESLLVASGLGNTPWTVLAQGVSKHSPLSIGAATFAISALVLLMWVPLRERPGLGTILNAVVVAGAIDVMLRWLPSPHLVAAQLGEVVGGIAAIGIGSALYLTTALGPGPRDGWMTGIARRTGRPIAAVRLGIELTALTVGFVLGGRVGVGTVLFAVTIGYAVAWSMTLLAQLISRLR